MLKFTLLTTLVLASVLYATPSLGEEASITLTGTVSSQCSASLSTQPSDDEVSAALTSGTTEGVPLVIVLNISCNSNDAVNMDLMAKSLNGGLLSNGGDTHSYSIGLDENASVDSSDIANAATSLGTLSAVQGGQAELKISMLAAEKSGTYTDTITVSLQAE